MQAHRKDIGKRGALFPLNVEGVVTANGVCGEAAKMRSKENFNAKKNVQALAQDIQEKTGSSAG